MGFITGLLKEPISSLISSVGNTVKQFVTTDADRLKAAEDMARIQADIEAKLIEADQAFADSQAKVIIAEAQSESWLTRSWRPIMMLFFGVLIGAIVWTGGYVNGHALDHDFLMDLMSTIKLGLSGYVVGRSVEKGLDSDSMKAISGALADKLKK